MSSPPSSSTPYIDPLLNDILYQIQYAVNAQNVVTGNDISLLSAIPYLPLATSGDPFSSTNQQQAVNSILSSFKLSPGDTALFSISGTSVTPPNTGPTAPDDPILLDAMAQVILNGNGGAASPFITYTPSPRFTYVSLMTSPSNTTVRYSALSATNLCEAFYQAGSTIFLQLLCERINQSASVGSAYGVTTGNVTPLSPVNPTLSVSSSTPTFQDVVDLTRYTIAIKMASDVDTTLINNRIQQLNLSPASFAAWASMQTASITDLSDINTFATNSLNYVLGVLGVSNASVINNPETVQALLTFGLGPWLVMAFISSFKDASNSFVTQTYSRIAVYYLAMVAFSNMLSAMTSVGGDNTYAAAFQLVVGEIQAQLASSINNIDNSGPIADVLSLSMQNNSVASDLALQSQSLQNRVGIASDLQVTYQYEQTRTQSRKNTFYAWLVAFIIVLVVSVFLIVSDRITLFLPFAYGTLLLILAVLILSWFVRWVGRNNRSSDDD